MTIDKATFSEVHVTLETGEKVIFENTGDMLENHGHSQVYDMDGYLNGELKYRGYAGYSFGSDDFETIEIETV